MHTDFIVFNGMGYCFFDKIFNFQPEWGRTLSCKLTAAFLTLQDLREKFFIFDYRIQQQSTLMATFYWPQVTVLTKF